MKVDRGAIYVLFFCTSELRLSGGAGSPANSRVIK
jgi:hypothetical protein